MVNAIPETAGRSSGPAAGRRLAIAGFGALALIVAALAYLFWPWAHVPDVTGRPETAAEATVDGTGLHWRRQEEPSDKAASGTVMRTAPPAGQMVDAGAVITLVIAVPVRITIPLAITGETAAAAAAELDRLGFRSRRQEEPSDSAAPGTVIGASPAPGQLVGKGAIVTLSIAVPISVTVPALIGQPAAIAGKALDRIGLKWESHEVATAVAAPGTVVAISPAAGATVDKGSAVALAVATPVRIAVPAIIGRAKADAEAALNEAGFKWQIQNQPSERASPGSVVGASPAVGQIADKGSVVALLIAVPVAVTVPAVVGRAEADAEAALKRTGLRWQRQTQPSDGAAPGSVLSASPAPGQAADKGSVVSLLIAMPVSVPVPAVAGQTLADAIAALGRSGLKWQRQDVAMDSAAPGRVVETAPASGQMVDKGSVVLLRVAAATTVAVPRVAGDRLAEAVAALGRAGLKAQRKDVAGDKTAAGRVVGTSPAEGQAVRKGMTVTVLVGRAAPAPRPAATAPLARYPSSPEPSLEPPAYNAAPAPPPSTIARSSGGYPSPAWGTPAPTPPPNPYSGAYGGRAAETPGPNWLLQTGPLSGADLVGHLYDNAHR